LRAKPVIQFIGRKKENLYIGITPSHVMKKNLSPAVLCFFALTFFLFACIKNENHPTAVSSDSTTSAPLQVSIASITLTGASAIDTVVINTSLSWKATASATWIHLDATQGTGVYKLKISADTNRTGNVQTGTVVLSVVNSSASPDTINIRQNPFSAPVDTGWIQLTTNSGLSTNAQPSLIYTYNGTLYFGWGNTGSQTIYSLDTTTYKWVPAITIPSTVQVVQTPTYFVIGTKLYIGGGYSTTNLGFYEYDMTQGNSPAAWRTLTSLPENMLNGAGFAFGGYGYVQTGENTAAGNNMMYQFSTTGASDPGTWTTLGPLNVTDGPAASFIIGNTVYFGGGSANATDPTLANAFFAMTPPTLTLTSIASIPEPVSPSPGQRFSTWTIGDTAYAYDQYVRALFSYDPTGNSWTQLTTIPTTSRVEYATYYNGHVYAWNDSGSIWEYLGQ
jgi:hypothetical protein